MGGGEEEDVGEWVGLGERKSITQCRHPFLTHSRTYPLTHLPMHSRTYPLTHALTHPLTHALTHPLTHAPTHSLTHSRTHSRRAKLATTAAEGVLALHTLLFFA